MATHTSPLPPRVRTVPSSVPRTGAGRSARAQSKHRPEIHGLRGLAIALVVLYHLWGAGRVSGGVDIFLMISAFLMVGSFVRRGSAFNLLDFLINRFRKLIPQAWLVIMATLVASWMILPPLKWASLLEQAASSLLYFQNWMLISLSTNYNVTDRSDTSVYQHFWSLSMQGQVFVIWPLIMVVAVLVERYAKIQIRTTLLTLFSAIGLWSFQHALTQLSTAPAAAYFDTWSRLWEFALASVIALLPAPHFTPVWSQRLSWAGLAGVVFSGLLVGRQPFPGPAALLPALSAIVVIWAGSSTQRDHCGYWLSTKPMAWLGDRAYAIYLWHWPVYMLYLYATDSQHLGFVGSLTVIGLALLLADLTTRLVDRRFNKWEVLNDRQYALMAMASFLIVGLAAVQVTQLAVHTGLATAAPQPKTQAVLAQEQASPTNPVDVQVPPAATPASPAQPSATTPQPGAASPSPSSSPTPTVSVEAYGGITGRVAQPGDIYIKNDWPWSPGNCPRELTVAGGNCFEYKASKNPSKTVVLFGDSHARQWYTALEPIAKKENWRVIHYYRPFCRNTISDPESDAECTAYSTKVRDKIVDIKPAFAITAGTRAHAAEPETVPQTHQEAMNQLLKAGIPVVNVRDNPRYDSSRPECVQRYGSTDSRCWAKVEDKLASKSPMEQWNSVEGMHSVDMTDEICPEGICPTVRNGSYVYMDDDHLSRTFILTIAPKFEAKLRAAMK